MPVCGSPLAFCRACDRVHRLRPVHAVDLTVEVPGIGEILLQRLGVVAHCVGCLLLLGVGQAPGVGEQLQPGHLQGHRGGVELLGRLHQRGLIGDPRLGGGELGLRLLHAGHRRRRIGGPLLGSSLCLRLGWLLAGRSSLSRGQGGLRLGEVLLRRGDVLPRADRGLAGVHRLGARLGEVRAGVLDVSHGGCGLVQDIAVAVQRGDVARARRTELGRGSRGRGLGVGQCLLLRRHAGLRDRHRGLLRITAAPGEHHQQAPCRGQPHDPMPPTRPDRLDDRPLAGEKDGVR